MSREDQMVVIERDHAGTPTVWCDPEIGDLVTALNAGVLKTVASCSGHGYRPGRISLADGRELIIARDYDEAARIDAMFPLDINGGATNMEGLGDALYGLSSKLLASGFLADDANRTAYEKVVARFQGLQSEGADRHD